VALEPRSVPIVIQYLNDLNLDFESVTVIPLGYDYGCERKKCTSKWQSY